ncbi:MAG: methyltransferase domain-containing protein [Candidatus Humimicrobiaceae bacterium]
MKAFIDTYLIKYVNKPLKILEVGSRVISPQISQKVLFTNNNWTYKGLDIEVGENVDIIPSNPYDWLEIEDNSFDVVISSQTFEHIPYFWVTAFEIGRILKDGGLAIIIAPTSGTEHRYPYDAFRYFPDGFIKLSEYMGFKTIEAYWQYEDLFYEDGSDYNRDCCIIMQKPFFSEEERKNFLIKNKIHKILLKNDLGILNNFKFEFGKSKTDKSIIQGESNKNCFINLHKKRKEKFSKFFLKIKKIKASIPIIINAFLGAKISNFIFKIYPKMAKWK